MKNKSVPRNISDSSVPDFLLVGKRKVRLQFHRNTRARRYILRMQSDGTARVTIPRGGSQRKATDFALRQTSWMERQLQNPEKFRKIPKGWYIGNPILFRGKSCPLIQVADPHGNTGIQLADHIVPTTKLTGNIRPILEGYLWDLARVELPPLVQRFADHFGLLVNRITIRNQKTRWGSCSSQKTISLNWRLIQLPPWVRDYIIIHELMHLKELNHSPRYWRRVAEACPHYEKAETWLKTNFSLLG